MELPRYPFKTGAMLGMLFLILISFAVANLQSLVWTQSEWMVSTVLPSVIVTDTNHVREDRERTTLVRNLVLDEAATLKAEHMARHGYFAHFSPDGISPWYWFNEAGYSFVHAGENLAVYFTDSSEIVEAWMDSPLHRANILDQNYTEIGVGVADGYYEGYKTVYVVQLFGTPAAPTNEEEIPTVEEVVPTLKTVSVPGPREHIATSTGKTAGASVVVSYGDTEPPWWATFLTKPSVWLQIVYVAVALCVVSLLLYSLVRDIRNHRVRDITYSVALLVLMLVLFEIHIAVSTNVLIV